MATELVETRLDSSCETLAAEAVGTTPLSTGSGLTQVRTKESGTLGPWFSGVGDRVQCAVEWVLEYARSAESPTETPWAPGPSFLRVESEELGMAQIRQGLIHQLWKSLRAAEADVAWETEDDILHWETVIQSPRAEPARQITFHLIRRGHQDPRVVAESDE